MAKAAAEKPVHLHESVANWLLRIMVWLVVFLLTSLMSVSVYYIKSMDSKLVVLTEMGTDFKTFMAVSQEKQGQVINNTKSIHDLQGDVKDIDRRVLKLETKGGG